MRRRWCLGSKEKKKKGHDKEHVSYGSCSSSSGGGGVISPKMDLDGTSDYKNAKNT